MIDAERKHAATKRRAARPQVLEIGVWVLIVAAGVAAAVSVHSRAMTAEQEKMAHARDTIRALMSALTPPDARYALPSTEEGLQALVRRGAISQVPDDPWGRPYVYRNPGKTRGIDLISLGPDGVESSDDLVAGDLYAKQDRNQDRNPRAAGGGRRS